MKAITRVPLTLCPRCNHKINSAGTRDGLPAPGPKEGDVSICIECGLLMVYTSDLHLYTPTDIELVNLLNDEEVISILNQWSKAQDTIH